MKVSVPYLEVNVCSRYSLLSQCKLRYTTKQPWSLVQLGG